MPAQLRVPGVGVDEVGVGDAGRHRQVDRHRPQRRQRGRIAGQRFPRPMDDRAVPAPRMHRDVVQRRQLARQVLDVHAGAAVHLGRVLACEQADLHARTTWPLPTTVTPPADTVKPRSRSRSWSTPTLAPSSTHTFLSRIARCTTASRPTSTPCIRTEASTSAYECRWTPGESTERRARAPESTTPAQTIESTA